MITDQTFDEFCNKYYLDARRAADVTVANFIMENGQPHRSIDLDLVKDGAMVSALRKAYERFDKGNEKVASIKTFLSTIVRNQVLTGLRNESSAVGANRKRSLYATDKKGSAQTDDGLEMAEIRSQVTESVRRLDPVDQVIINCWMEDKRSYCDEALSMLGWDEDKREEVKERKKKAFNQLQRMLNEYGPGKAAKEEPQTSTEDSPKKTRKTVNVYHLPLRDMEPYVNLVKQYTGLFHPSLEPELALLEVDPDRSFELYEYVLHVDIETAFDEGHFTCDTDLRRVCIDLLWLIANLYYGDFYQQYQDYFNDMVSDELTWDEIYDDILRLYAFMHDHKAAVPIEMKYGKEKVVIMDTEGWFQALMDNHLFPKCCPEIKSKEQVIERFRKSAGRKVENELAVAIINGVAKFFADKELIKGQAPKNLCSFIRQYLILMELLDLDYRVISETSIKSAINYAAKKETDPRLPSTEVSDATLEDLKHLGVIPGERWLFTKG